MTQLKKKILLGIAALALAVASWAVGGQKLGSATPGLSAEIASSSQVAIGPQENIVIFTPLNSCSSRVITTESANIRLSWGTSFADNDNNASSTVSATRGHLQVASTTVAYDSGTYGCRYVAAFAYASTTITISEYR